MRDDDPIHPDFSGVQFQAVTDKSGILARPESGNTQLVASFLPLDAAKDLATHLGELIVSIRSHDARSYAADFFEVVLDDLGAAIRDCL